MQFRVNDADGVARYDAGMGNPKSGSVRNLLTEKAYTAPTWHPDLTNKNGLPEGKPLICLVAGTGFEPVTFGL